MNPNHKVGFIVGGSGPCSVQGSIDTVSTSKVRNRDRTLTLGTCFSLVAFTPGLSSLRAIAPLKRLVELLRLEEAKGSWRRSVRSGLGVAMVPQECVVRVGDSTAKNSARSTTMAKPMETSNMDIDDGEQHQPELTKLMCFEYFPSFRTTTHDRPIPRTDTTGLCIIVKCR